MSALPTPPSNSNGGMPPALSDRNALVPAPAPKQGGEDDGFDSRAILQIARRRWWLILLVTVLVGSVQWYRVLKRPPRYQTRAEILIEPIAGEQEVAQLNEALSTVRSSAIDYPTQIAVLKSTTVLKPIYEKILANEDLKPIIGKLAYGTLVSNLQILRLGDTKILRLTFEDSDANRAKAVLEGITDGYIQYSVEAQLTGQREGLKLVEEQLPTLYDRVDEIQLRLENFRQRHNVIDPVDLGQRLTASLTALREQQSQAAVSLEEAGSLRSGLEARLGVELSEAITTVTLSESPRYQGFLQELQEVETSIALELTRFKADTPNIQVLEERRDTLQRLLREEAALVLADQPGGEVVASTQVEGRLASPNPLRLSLTQQLVEVTNTIASLRVRQDALVLAENNIRSNLDEVAELAREYQNIQIELDVATGSLNRFLGLRERLQVESVQKTLPWQVLEAPKVGYQISGNLQRGLVYGVLMGLGAGIAIAYLAEKIDTKFHSPEVLKEATGVPILGVIPFQRGLLNRVRPQEALGGSADASPSLNAGNLQVSERYRSFPFQEAFRSLHTNLAFMNPDSPLRSVVISSCIPKEGKSTTSAYLAQAAAAMGKKVLLVDADMRRPTVHQLMELPNTWGLSNVISTGLNLDDAIQQSPLSENLYVLTSGPTPPDPTRLLSSQMMASLVQQWQEAFNLVIFDSPPLGGLADARLLAAHTDGLLMVAGLGVVDRSLLRDVLESLRLSRSKLLGIVANSRKAASVDSSYYYSYYYRYYLSNPSKEDNNGAATEEDVETTVSPRDRDNPGE